MGNYENLKQSITEVIRTNGNQEITGAVLQSTLLTIISTVGANATFAGIATPTTNPGTPDGPVFWIASESGTYTNFGSIELQDGLSVLMWNGSWSSQQIFSIDDVPTAGSDNLVKSGGIYAKIKAIEDAGYVFSGVATPTTDPGTPNQNVFYLAEQGGTYLNFGNIELQDGLSVLMLNNSTWSAQQIFINDDMPTDGSKNLVKSGGVAKLIERVENTEDKYISATIDKNKKIIEAIGKDGLKHLFGGFTNEAKIHKCDNNPEFVEVLLDSNNKIIEAVDKNGLKHLLGGFTNEAKAHKCDNNPEFVEVLLDSNNKMLESISKNGKKTFYGDVEVKGNIHVNGFDENTLLGIKESVISKNAFLRLPDTLHICQGVRSQIYAHEMIAGDYPELYHVNDQDNNYLSPFMNVGTGNVGTSVRNIQIRDTQGIVAEKSLVIDTFANPSTNVSLKILQFGDSKSENMSKFAELMNLLQKDGNKITITWLGNRTSTAKDSDGNIHTITNQAVSGTTLFDYLTSSAAWNIFYDENLDSGVNITAMLQSKPVKFSIAKAIETLGDVPDIVWCDHGANESWDYYFPDSTIIACYDYLINDIKAYNQAHNTNIKLVISDQEGSGLSETINGGIGKKVSLYWRRLRLYTNRIQNRESEGIYLCPNWLFVDLYNDFPMAYVPTNSCNKQLHKIVVDTIHCGKNVNNYSSSQQYNYGDIVGVGENMYICVNETPITNVEPNDDKVNWAQVIPDSISVGYWHIGHAYYHTLKYIVSRDY